VSDIDFPLNPQTYVGGRLLENLLLFGRLCKMLGLEVTPNGMIEVARALEFIDLGHKADFYYSLRALIVTRQRDLPLFDKAFKAFWRPPSNRLVPLSPPPPQIKTERKMQFLPPPGASPAEDDPASAEESRLIAIVPTHSELEALRYKNFGDMTPDEMSSAKQLMQRLSWSLGTRRTRRFSAGKGASLDIRRAFRRSMRVGGELLILPTRRRKIKPRPLVVLCDISGSMERYTRLLLHFLHTLAGSIYQVESFVFSTRLIRITRPLRHKSVDRALREIGSDVNIWGSGTRTGAALHSFNYHWSRRVLGHGAVVLLITDGWDRGENAELRHEIARLQRSCYRLLWLNPLIGDPNYAPLTQGAQAMLPFVDDFLPVHNLASLDMLAQALGQVDWRRPNRSRYAHLLVNA
jgi:uncharacterized protein with von Willebrand factor type A (vWA) domain